MFDDFVSKEQVEELRSAVREHVFGLLGIREIDGEVVDECVDDYKAYYTRFVRELHHDAKKAGIEGTYLTWTRKDDFHALVDYIREWVPSRGVEGQKAHYDDLRKSR